MSVFNAFSTPPVINQKQKILKRLLRVWEKYPNLRLGQLMAIKNSIIELYYKTDEELLSDLESADLKDLEV